jgi:hypothetical protein
MTDKPPYYDPILQPDEFLRQKAENDPYWANIEKIINNIDHSFEKEEQRRKSIIGFNVFWFIARDVPPLVHLLITFIFGFLIGECITNALRGDGSYLQTFLITSMSAMVLYVIFLIFCEWLVDWKNHYKK